MRHRISLQVGPIGLRVGAAWAAPIAALRTLYAGYPEAAHPDFTVRLEPARPWRRWIRPAVLIDGDYRLPGAAPLPLAQGLLAAEMGMNLQVALGERRFLLIHAASLERDGRALILTGVSGSGKSTLAALLAERGWRFMGDEFALIDPAGGLAYPFPRPTSLKNESVAVLEGDVAAGRFGARIDGTPKGSIRHLRPAPEAIVRMAEPARPALILFPRFGAGLAGAARPVGRAEAFVRLTQASTNYTALGESGFAALTRLVASVPAIAIDFGATADALALVERTWREAAA